MMSGVLRTKGSKMILKILLKMLFSMSTLWLGIMILLYECELIKSAIIGPILIFICGVIALICLYIEAWKEHKRYRKVMRELETENIPWWKLKEYGGWI
jgi:hypothetical protein